MAAHRTSPGAFPSVAHARLRSRRALVPVLLASIALAGCGRSEPVLQASIANVACEPAGHRVAVAVRVARVAHPRGLAAFPDGGVAHELEARADFWLVDAATGSIDRVASVERPSHMRTQFMPWVSGWSGGAPVVKVTGYPGAETSAGALRMRVLRLPPAGPPEALPVVPEDAVLEQRAPVDARRRARTRWVEASRRNDTLDVRTEREPALRAAFVVDRATGELRTLPRAAAPASRGRH